MGTRVSRTVIISTSIFLLLSMNVSFGQEKEFPTRPVNLYIGYPPGGGVSNQALVLVEVMKKYLNQPVILNYKPGAAQAVAADFVCKSKPDGYTLLYMSEVDTIIKLILDGPTLKFTLNDFVSLGATGMNTNALVVKSDSQWKTVEDLIEFGRKSGALTIGGSGLGTMSHIIADLFASKTGVPSTYVPFQGGGPADTALLGGHINSVVGSLGRYMERLRPGGGLRALVIFNKKRHPNYSELPTMLERGYDIVISGAFGLHAPKGLPSPIKNILIQAFEKSTRNPQLTSFLGDAGYIPAYISPEEEDKMNQSDYVLFQELLTKAGLVKK